MDYIFLRDYSPFKEGRIVKLPPMTSAKLVAAGIVKPYEPAAPKKILKKAETSQVIASQPLADSQVKDRPTFTELYFDDTPIVAKKEEPRVTVTSKLKKKKGLKKEN